MGVQSRYIWVDDGGWCHDVHIPKWQLWRDIENIRFGWWNMVKPSFLVGFPWKDPNEYMPMPAFTHVATLTCHRTLLLDSPQACELAFRLGSCKRALAQISDPTWIQIRKTQMSMVRTPHSRWFCSKVLSAMDWMDCKMKHIEQRWIWSGDATNAQKIAPACSLRAQTNPTGKGTQDPRIPAETARLRTLRPSWSISVNSQPRCHSQRLRVNLRSSISSFVRKVDWGILGVRLHYAPVHIQYYSITFPALHGSGRRMMGSWFSTLLGKLAAGTLMCSGAFPDSYFPQLLKNVTQVSLGRVRVWPQERVRCLLADVSGSSPVELQAPDATVTGSKYQAISGDVGNGWLLDNDNDKKIKNDNNLGNQWESFFYWIYHYCDRIYHW